MTDDDNIPTRHRFGGKVDPLSDLDRRLVRWLLVGLAAFWIGAILLLRGCA